MPRTLLTTCFRAHRGDAPPVAPRRPDPPGALRQGRGPATTSSPCEQMYAGQTDGSLERLLCAPCTVVGSFRWVYEPGRQDRESVRLWLDIGREKGIRAGDIVGAIANEANIPGRLIGSIELHDGFSYVSVPSRDARKVIDVLNRATIRGHKVRANIVVAKKGN